jgi:hypothetical protein
MSSRSVCILWGATVKQFADIQGTQMRIQHSNMLAMANFLCTKTEPKLVPNLSPCQLSILMDVSTTSLGIFSPSNPTSSRTKSPKHKLLLIANSKTSIPNIQKQQQKPLKKKKPKSKLTTRPSRRWVSLVMKSSLLHSHLQKLMILLIHPSKPLSQRRRSRQARLWKRRRMSCFTDLTGVLLFLFQDLNCIFSLAREGVWPCMISGWVVRVQHSNAMESKRMMHLSLIHLWEVAQDCGARATCDVPQNYL